MVASVQERMRENVTFPGAEDWKDVAASVGTSGAAAADGVDPFDDAETKRMEVEVASVAARVKHFRQSMPGLLEKQYDEQIQEMRPKALASLLEEAAADGDGADATDAPGTAEGAEGPEELKQRMSASVEALPELRKRMEAALEKMGRVVAACQAEKARSDIASPATTPAPKGEGQAPGTGGKVAIRTRLAAAARAAPY